ncbi:hypothetical protein Tco_1189338, partial [Tanacetum coccineum]
MFRSLNSYPLEMEDTSAHDTIPILIKGSAGINGSSVKTPKIPLNKLGHDLNGKAVNEIQYRDIKQILRNPTLLLLREFSSTSHSEEEKDYALMACNSSGSDTEVTSCSKEYKESYAKLKKLYDEQRAQLSDASIETLAYTQALKKGEAQLVAHQQ